MKKCRKMLIFGQISWVGTHEKTSESVSFCEEIMDSHSWKKCREAPGILMSESRYLGVWVQIWGCLAANFGMLRSRFLDVWLSLLGGFLDAQVQIFGFKVLIFAKTSWVATHEKTPKTTDFWENIMSSYSWKNVGKCWFWSKASKISGSCYPLKFSQGPSLLETKTEAGFRSGKCWHVDLWVSAIGAFSWRTCRNLRTY